MQLGITSVWDKVKFSKVKKKYQTTHLPEQHLTQKGHTVNTW